MKHLILTFVMLFISAGVFGQEKYKYSFDLMELMPKELIAEKIPSGQKIVDFEQYDEKTQTFFSGKGFLLKDNEVKLINFTGHSNTVTETVN